MTQEVLILALQKQPPAHVIKFMLSVNPRVGSSIPKEGPTPLQVAVIHNASIEVIEILLQACPFSLCVTNPTHAEDPLSYAKRHRKDDKALIDLLSQPLSYWVEERCRDPEASLTNITSSSHADNNGRTPPPSSHHQYYPPVDKQELYNVKLLCAKLLKNHKKMMKQMNTCQEGLEENKICKDEILQELHGEQKKHFYRQLIALDMKERAMKAQVSKIENRCIDTIDDKFKTFQKDMRQWQTSTNTKMQEWQIMLEHEIKMNAHFRNDLGQWMEEQISEQENTPFLFATPLGELDEEVPLVSPSKTLAADGSVEVELEELIHVKKRPWKPFFSRHWDRIMLVDEEEI